MSKLSWVKLSWAKLQDETTAKQDRKQSPPQAPIIKQDKATAKQDKKQEPAAGAEKQARRSNGQARQES